MIKSHISKVMGPTRLADGRFIFIPHLILTYYFIGLMSSVVYHLFGREVLITLFSWYYLNHVNEVLMYTGILTYILRVWYFNIINRA